MTVPTVVRRLDMASSVNALKQVGDASVNPYDDVNSVIPNLLTSNSIRYRGTGAPAIMPVRRVQLKSSGSASNRESNMAGTPWMAVQFSSTMAASVAGISNVSAG